MFAIHVFPGIQGKSSGNLSNKTTFSPFSTLFFDPGSAGLTLRIPGPGDTWTSPLLCHFLRGFGVD
jgi:hypothetical protein